MNQKEALVQTFATMTPDELAVTIPKWRAKIKFQVAEVDAGEIRLAFHLQDESDREVLNGERMERPPSSVSRRALQRISNELARIRIPCNGLAQSPHP